QLGVIRNALAGNIGDDRDPPGGPNRRDISEDGLDADILKPDRVKHPASGLDDPGLSIPLPGSQGYRLADDRPEALDIENLRILEAVAERPRGSHYGVREGKAAFMAGQDFHAEVRHLLNVCPPLDKNNGPWQDRACSFRERPKVPYARVAAHGWPCERPAPSRLAS